jgi:hypothetical protein
MSVGAKLGWGLGISAGLGVAASLLSPKEKNAKDLNAAELYARQMELESAQNSLIGGRTSGTIPMMQINPQGGYSLLGQGYTPSTRRFAEGDSLGSMVNTSAPAYIPNNSGGGGGNTLHMTINDNRSQSQHSTQGGGLSPEKMEMFSKFVEAKYQELTDKNFRNGGVFRQSSRYMNPTY